MRYAIIPTRVSAGVEKNQESEDDGRRGQATELIYQRRMGEGKKKNGSAKLWELVVWCVHTTQEEVLEG